MAPHSGSGPALGILGGSFDPVHLGHLVAARDVAEALGLERIILVPAGVPPHKMDGAVAPGGVRRRLLEEAVRGDALFEVDGAELEREGPSYTVETLRAFRERWPDARLHLLIGADQWRSFHRWKEPAEVARLAHLVVMTRAGDGADAGARTKGDFPHRGVRVTRLDISSTEIRHRLMAGRSVRYLVPPGVEHVLHAGDGPYRNGKKA